MALKPATVGIVLAISLTILTAMASATPNDFRSSTSTSHSQENCIRADAAKASVN